MKTWIMSANPQIYDHQKAFETNGYIDWGQSRNFEIGDFVYIYCSKGISQVRFLTIVERVNMSETDIVDDTEFWKIEDVERKKRYVRLRLLERLESPELSLEKLKEHGMKYAPQSPCVVKDELGSYLALFFKERVQ